MAEDTDSLRCLFSADIDEHDGTYSVTVPATEVVNGSVTPGATYRVAILDQSPSPDHGKPSTETVNTSKTTPQTAPPDPPVSEGETREVSIESVGDQGDGIAKVERGFVVIVPGTHPGDEPTVEIQDVRENVAFASVSEPDQRTL